MPSGIIMDSESMEFWTEIDNKLADIIDLIRLKYTKFNGTPVEKVILKLFDAYRASGQVADAIDKGWIK